MPNEETFNSGVTWLSPISDAFGQGVDKVNLIVCLFAGVPISLLYRRYLAAGRVSRNVRLVFPLVTGLLMCAFMFGSGFKHVLVLVFGSYVLIHVTPLNHVHRVIFIYSMGYLSWIHAYRYLYLTSYNVDITGPMMTVVQKLTTVAFSIHDGQYKQPKGERLNASQRKEAIVRMPSLLEFTSYSFNYMNILCGPLCFYADYIAFIDGFDRPIPIEERNGAVTTESDDERELTKPMPIPQVATGVLVKKGREALFFLLLAMFIAPLFPMLSAVDGSLDGYSIVRWLIYIHLSATFIRCQYFFVWIMADVVHNAAGFGYDHTVETDGVSSVLSEWDADCHRWSLVCNVRAVQVETSDSWKVTIDSWNISTMRWLRRVAYDRLHVRLRTGMTYFVSAWWHGFFPGYYWTFSMAALATSASRRVRRCVRHYFLGTPAAKRFYDCLTFISSKVTLTFVGAPFALMHWHLGIALYARVYFIPHFLMLFAILLLPRLLRVVREKDLKSGLREVSPMLATRDEDAMDTSVKLHPKLEKVLQDLPSVDPMISPSPLSKRKKL